MRPGPCHRDFNLVLGIKAEKMCKNEFSRPQTREDEGDLPMWHNQRLKSRGL